LAAFALAGVALAAFAACDAFSGNDTSNVSSASDGSADRAQVAMSDGASSDAGASSSSLDAVAPPPFCSTIDASLCDDFERDPADAKGPWTTLAIDGLGSTLVIGDGGGDRGSVAIADVAPNQGDAYLSASFPAEMTTGDVSLDVLFRGIEGSTQIAGFELGDNGPDNRGRRLYFEQSVGKTSLVGAYLYQPQSLVYVSPSDSQTALMENVWYHVRVHIELTDGGIDGTLFVNGARIAEVKPSGMYAAPFTPAAPTINVGIHSAGSPEGGHVEVLVDNFVITF
jgi:hypothetical protein